MIQVLGWVAFFSVISTYYLTTARRPRYVPFMWANFLGSFVFGWLQWGIWQPFCLTVCFGCIGAKGLAQTYFGEGRGQL